MVYVFPIKNMKITFFTFLSLAFAFLHRDEFENRVPEAQSAARFARFGIQVGKTVGTEFIKDRAGKLVKNGINDPEGLAQHPGQSFLAGQIVRDRLPPPKPRPMPTFPHPGQIVRDPLPPPVPKFTLSGRQFFDDDQDFEDRVPEAQSALRQLARTGVQGAKYVATEIAKDRAQRALNNAANDPSGFAQNPIQSTLSGQIVRNPIALRPPRVTPFVKPNIPPPPRVGPFIPPKIPSFPSIIKPFSGYFEDGELDQDFEDEELDQDFEDEELDQDFEDEELDQDFEDEELDQDFEDDDD